EALREDAVSVAVLAGALPDDDEIAARIDRQLRKDLVSRRVRVDLELASQLGPGGVEALTEDAVAGPVAAVVLPHDDEASRSVSGDPRVLLEAGQVRVHLELRTDLGARRVEALSDDSQLKAALPDGDEFTGVVERDGGVVLPAGRVRVDRKFRAD